jgi:beta-galactosidase
MFAIVRSCPYICSEREFGDLSSWLLRDKDMKVRSQYSPFLNATENCFKKIVEIIKSFQFSTNGGPIIAVQVENEFADFGNTKSHKTDEQYLTFLKDTLTKHGIKELFFTSDNS